MQRSQEDLEEQVKVSYGDFCELRSLKHPPQAVKELFLALLLLLGEPVHKATDWRRRLRLLKTSKRDGVLQRMVELNVRHIDLGTALKAKDALKPFTVEIMRNVSAAAASFFLWACAMIEAVELQAADGK
ncbi:kyphoscoliosis peptidase [Plakobranchus ocellatus]|uniref:Kyphoscoliosis peptidase n=1 Tax=Plakobranchus ocellatus TaxID=259542 RepID=A0AAV3YAJ3_9GAST|nr:kyphoscoliosis peptidase [Plakobranchus ocellatus]